MILLFTSILLLFALFFGALYIVISKESKMREETNNPHAASPLPDLTTMPYGEILVWLQHQGCVPSAYWRGDRWRAFVNREGNWWEEGPTAKIALMSAIKEWNKAGRPLDGAA